MNAIKQKILEQAQRDGVQVTALREQVLDIVLKQSGVIKAYNVLSQMQQQSEGVVAPPTAYRALDFWASATTIATTTKKPKRTIARLFWFVPNAVRQMSRP